MAIESISTCQEPKRSSQGFLPTETIVEILSRLPVKSLLRFRCVSKSWRSLISQPKFARTHLRLASMNADYTHHRLFLSGLSYGGDVKSCSLYSILNDRFDTAVKLDCPLTLSNGLVWIVGCCDGLVCIAASCGKLFIWNPSTRKSKRLPKIPYPGYMGHGFGYDKSNGDYKVVAFSGNERGASGVEIEVQVYTLGTASWRRIEGFSHYHLDNKGKYLNGALHWTAHRESNVTAVIVSVDLAKETHGEILEPDYRDGYLYRSLLDVLNGYLCVLCSYRDYADVWVMKEYGTRESWTKLVVIPYVKHPWGCLDPDPDPVFILKNGEVLLHNYMHLVRYNPKDGAFRYRVIHNCSAHFSVYPYIESLVSLDIDADSGVWWQH